MQETSVTDALCSYLLRLSRSPDAAAVDNLRRLIFGFVDEHRSHGWPPERVLIALKSLAHECGLRPSGLASARVTPASREELFDHMMQWSIERYFVDATPTGQTRRGMTLM